MSVILIHGKKDPTVAYESTASALLRGMSAPETAKWWAKRNGTSGSPRRQEMNGGTWWWRRTDPARRGAEVVLVSIANGLHNRPGGLTRAGAETLTGVVAADLLWDFFKAHPEAEIGGGRVEEVEG